MSYDLLLMDLCYVDKLGLILENLFDDESQTNVMGGGDGRGMKCNEEMRN